MINPKNDSRKIFFLYPHLETEKKIATEVFAKEYETFLINDHVAVRKLIREISRSFIFVNTDKSVKNHPWAEYIKEISNINISGNVMVGTLSNDINTAEVYKSLSNISLSIDRGSGYCAETILHILEKDNARGNRKYVRAKCADANMASFSIKKSGSLYAGSIRDISIYAMACTLQEGTIIKGDSNIDDLQLRLNGKILKTAGEIIGTRLEDQIYVIKFDPLKTFPVKKIIHNFIFNALQRALDKKMKDLK